MFSDELWRRLTEGVFSSPAALVDALVVVVLIGLLAERAIVHARTRSKRDVPGTDAIVTTPLLVVLAVVLTARMAAIVT